MIAEGDYFEGKKQGDWKYYHYKYDKVSPLYNYSGKLRQVSHYDQGVLNGKTTVYSYADDIPIPCDLKVYPDKTPLDTCYKEIIVKSPATYYYKDDVLHGPIEFRDSANVITRKGIYVNGEMHGPF